MVASSALVGYSLQEEESEIGILNRGRLEEPASFLSLVVPLSCWHDYHSVKTKFCILWLRYIFVVEFFLGGWVSLILGRV